MAKIKHGLTDIQKIAKDCYEGKVEKYSNGSANEVLRNTILELVGGEWTYGNFQKNKWEVYALVQEMVDVNINRLTRDAFSDFTEITNYDLGDAPNFRVKNKNLFKVAVIADGINSIRRQKKLDGKLQTSAFKLAIAIYEEFDKFISGRIDWQDLVDSLSESFNQEIATQIAGSFEGAYDDINANLKKSTNAAGVDAELKKIINKVEGATGKRCRVYGTAEALGAIQGAGSEIDKEDHRNFGVVRLFNGTPLVKLQNSYDESTNKWAIRNDMLYVIPEGEKIIKLALEGGVTVLEDTTGMSRADQQVEMLMMQKIHLGVLVAAKFGAVQITA
ncbi:hypothetical protein [Paraclostridium sordellii]|uniref:hypothetical protein n=1 Tax=Paraclostridium sordellii TaxID=1505 RepID=UPI0022E892BD|nr:hypothetical protein [Paeniclostridium sordellii]